MATSETKRNKQRIQNYFLVKEALFRHFPEKAIYYDDLSHSAYLNINYFFPTKGGFIVLYYDTDIDFSILTLQIQSKTLKIIIIR